MTSDSSKKPDFIYNDNDQAPGSPAKDLSDSEMTLDEAKAEIASLKDRLLRALADASNARNRAGLARDEGRKAGIAAAIEAMLPALDSLDLALKSAEAHEAEFSGAGTALLDGVRHTHSALLDNLGRLGVTRIDPAGEKFDPNQCEAISTREDETTKPNTVLETVQPGYRFEQRLIRPAFVIVSISKKNEGPEMEMEPPKEKKPTIVAMSPVREVVGVVDSLQELETAVDRLMAAGIDRSDIDLMADRMSILRKLGKYYVDPVEAADNPLTPRRPLVLREDLGEGAAAAFGLLTYLGAIGAAGAVLASGGALAAAALAAIAGGAASGGLGALFGRSLTQRQLEMLESELEGGGRVLFVRLRSKDQEERVKTALSEAGAENIFVHEIELPRTVEDVPLHDINPDPWLGDERLGDIS